MASAGMLAAGAAHEIATPLAAVVANLDHSRRALEAASRFLGWNAEAREALGDALDGVADAQAGANHAAAVMRDLKLFSRPAEEWHVSMELRTAADRAVRLVAPRLREAAPVVTEFRDAPPVLGSESLLTQVFVDLLVNAGQAIEASPGADNEIAVGVWGSGDEVIAEVRDTGHGIPPATLPRIFQPFFTTKPPGVGTGLGLWICRRIVSAHGGRIEADSVLGIGTRMRIRLPAHVGTGAGRRRLPKAGKGTSSRESSAPWTPNLSRR